MAEVTKPDYLSLVNQSGSGFNVSELVDSIVASEIEPKRILQNTKLERTESAISGIGSLNSQAYTTEKNFNVLSEDKYFEITSSNSTGIEIEPLDETKLSEGIREISNVSMARKMVFELKGFTSLTDLHSANLTIDIGSWTKTEASGDQLTATYEAGKAYIVQSEITDANEISALDTKTDWNDTGSAIPIGTTIIVNGDVASGVLSAAKLKPVDRYTFQDVDVGQQTLVFANKNLTQIAAEFNSLDGLSAKIVDTTGSGSNYSLVLTSDVTGANKGFRIAGEERWTTPNVPAASSHGTFSQLSRDASFSLDGIQVMRSSNAISDLIDGTVIHLKSDFASPASVSVNRSQDAIKAGVQDVIFSLNEFKTEIDRLTYIDIEGNENGPLAMDPSATAIKSKFKRLALEPLYGFGDSPIYLSQLGVKTSESGEYYFDEAAFARTYNSNPSYFNALKDENLSTNDASVRLAKSQFTRMDVGSYEVRKVGEQWKLGDLDLIRTDYDGGSRFTTNGIAGFAIYSPDVEPQSFTVFYGKSFSEKIAALTTEITDNTSSIKSAEESYQKLTADIQERLDQLEVREKLISERYTEQFGKMEQSMTQFNSTKTLLENFIEAWKKQK